ncbi:MAG: T6SS immunity protein Tli4 family protein, partial [Neisseriaceae bacterium]|nr:T6SS immunity protein Tli4 family protein [Neisseriaceae bacterium]
SDLFYNHDRIRISKDETIQSTISSIENVKNEGVDYNDLYVLDKDLIPSKAHFYVTKYGFDWDMDIVRDFGNPYFTTLFNQVDDNWLYIIYTSFTIAAQNAKAPKNLEKKEQEKIQQAEKYFQTVYISQLEARNKNTLPNQSGVCLNGGFLKDNGKNKLVGDSTITFNDLNDMNLVVYMGYPYNRKNLPLLKRDILNSSSEFINTVNFDNYKTIRKGLRNINGLSGSEVLLSLGKDNYYFIWESDNQEVQIELAKRSNQPRLSEQQMLQAWDSILPTFKRHH